MKNMKNKSCILIPLLISVLTLLLNGCSLARKDAGTDAKDTLIGVFITDGYLDMFDMDAWLNANATGLLSNSDTIIDNSDEYTKPLYAKINRHGSDSPLDWDISFGDIKGFKYLSPVFKDKDGSITRSSLSDDALFSAHTNFTETDNGNETEMSVTVYSVPGAVDDFGFYANPVYQTADGKIYALPGSGISCDSSSEGETMSTSLSDQIETVEDRKTKTEKATITIRYSVMFEPLKITLIQMDDKNTPLKQDIYTPGKLPEQLTAEKNTAYFIVETEKKAPDGSIMTDRSIYGPWQSENEIFLETFYAIDNGIITKQDTDVIWKK